RCSPAVPWRHRWPRGTGYRHAGYVGHQQASAKPAGSVVLRSVAPFGDATHVPAIIAPGQFDAVANGLAVQRDDTVGSVRMVYTAQPQYQQAAAAIVATAGLIDGYLHTSAGLLPIEASAQGGHVGRATCRFATRLL